MSNNKKNSQQGVRLKSEEDIKKLRVAGSRLAIIMKEVSDHVKPGISTAELDKIFYELIIKGGDTPALLNYQPYGADYPYPATVCISINDEVVHGIPDDNRIIKEGDIVKLDSCLSHEGMIADHAVTLAVGEITEQEKKLIEVTKEARSVGIRAVKVGGYVSDISKAIEEYIMSQGDYGIVRILSGHGVGYAVHEEPFVPNYDDGMKGPKLVPGMVLAIEPMVNLGSDDCELCADGYTFVTEDGQKSAHFEHTVVITEKGVEIITA
ncbi:MAG: methionyl aminopeptidase [Patescibacteria group bacterium]|nr:methionyl aminopeptidase [Patescibacteria group bacterium]